MAVFGWIVFSLFALFGFAMLVIYAIPYVVSLVKTISYKTKKMVEDYQFDANKRSEERQHRNEIQRQKEFELANKKLDAKLQKVDKQIEILEKKKELANNLKEQTVIEKAELQKEKPKEIKLNIVEEQKVNSNTTICDSTPAIEIIEEQEEIK